MMNTKFKAVMLMTISVITLSSCNGQSAGCCSADKSKTSCSKECSTNKKINVMKTDSITPKSFDNTNLVCTLSGPELAEQKEKLQKEVFLKVKKTEEIELGYVFTFEYDEQFILKMTDYAIAENNCCPFLQFDISLKSKNDVVLKITGGSKQAKKMIKRVLVDGLE